MSNVKIEFTKKEAMQLLHVAGNGYGSGDFYGINEETGKGNGYGNKKERDAFVEAYRKLATKLNLLNIDP